MATPTYDLIASNVLSSSASSVTFSSIPSTYRDLILVCDFTLTGSSTLRMICNAQSTAGSYARVTMSGNGTSASSTNDSSMSILHCYGNESMTSTSHPVSIFQFLDYSATDKHKTILERTDAANARTLAQTSRFVSTNAITQIEFYPTDQPTDQFASGSTFYLYGIAG